MFWPQILGKASRGRFSKRKVALWRQNNNPLFARRLRVWTAPPPRRERKTRALGVDLLSLLTGLLLAPPLRDLDIGRLHVSRNQEEKVAVVPPTMTLMIH